jgi:chromatin segregation and condensation protein Rec8/ScpA/Scc1 (kleisin family)
VEELDTEEAAEELAERLAAYRRIKAAAGWLEERLAGEGDRWFRLGPAPLAPPAAPPRVEPQDPVRLAAAIRRLAVEPPAPSLRHLGVFPPVSQFVERFLELRKAGDVTLRQLAPFEPIAVACSPASA